MIDRLQKRRIYARAAVQFVWHIEPSELLLTAWRLNGADFQELGVWSPDETPTVRVAPFDALALDLASLWDGVTP